MPSCRCQYTVFDGITKKYRRCKKAKKFNNYCNIHLQNHFLKKKIINNYHILDICSSFTKIKVI